MGYNRALVQDESVSFVFTFSSSEPGAALSVCGLKSGGLLLEKTVTRCAMEADRNPTKVKGANNVLVYREVTDHRITFVYQNKSESSTIVQMELNKSKGIVHSRESEASTSLSKIVNNITQTQRSPSHKIQITLGKPLFEMCIRIGGKKDNFVSDTFRHFFGQKWHLSHQNTQLKAYFG